jgi:hypothetical protein
MTSKDAPEGLANCLQVDNRGGELPSGGRMIPTLAKDTQPFIGSEWRRQFMLPGNQLDAGDAPPAVKFIRSGRRKVIAGPLQE